MTDPNPFASTAFPNSDAPIMKQHVPAAPTGWRVWLQRIWFSRDRLQREHCARGLHWMSWWQWYEGVMMPGGLGFSMTGWFRVCRVCRGRHEFDAKNTRRPSAWWPWRLW